MLVQLLPAYAAPFSAQPSSIIVVLGSKVEPWLTETLKIIKKPKKPLNSVLQHELFLAETLSSPNAIWTLTSLLLPKTPASDFKRDSSNPLYEAIVNHEFIHVEAYIVYVDMVLNNQVAYKLTSDTIDALIQYHENIHCVNAKACTEDWPDKEQQCRKLHDDFVQEVNKFIFFTHASALEGLVEGGAGELLCGKSEKVKIIISTLMKPLLPPRPCSDDNFTTVGASSVPYSGFNTAANELTTFYTRNPMVVSSRPIVYALPQFNTFAGLNRDQDYKSYWTTPNPRPIPWSRNEELQIGPFPSDIPSQLSEARSSSNFGMSEVPF